MCLNIWYIVQFPGCEVALLNAYEVTIEQIRSVSDAEFVFSTSRLMPVPGQLPERFIRGNEYTVWVERYWAGLSLDSFDVRVMAGVALNELQFAIKAHLKSDVYPLKHRVSGMALLLSQFAKIKVGIGPGCGQT